MHIHIENYTIIDMLDLDFSEGMTVLTGETGAGKSIIIDALELILGGRGDSKTIRMGKDRCDLIASFDIQSLHDAKEWLQRNEYYSPTEECILRRIITQDGRSKCYINNKLVSLQALREIGAYLVSIHGQHEHQNLLKRDEQQHLLDLYANQIELNEKIGKIAKNWSMTKSKLKTLEIEKQKQTAKIDLLHYQLEELEELAIEPSEVLMLEQEYKQLSKAEDLIQYYEEMITFLAEGEEGNVLNLLHRVSHILTSLHTFNDKLTNTQELITNATVQIEESINEIRYFLDKTSANPERLQYIQSRLQKIYDIARKHRINPEEIYNYWQSLRESLTSFLATDKSILALQQEIEIDEKEYYVLAIALSEKRLQAAQLLSEKITQSMQELGMMGGRFHIALEPSKLREPHPKGFDRVEFLVATNPGQELQALNKVASGGELSRISLAIQVITANKNLASTLIFDEVDVGIGGTTAAIVGKLLRELSEKNQIFCITHLPQVASCGHHHYQVKKIIEEKYTHTEIEKLSSEQKIEEIARMLGGLKITEQTIAHAKEMLSIL